MSLPFHMFGSQNSLDYDVVLFVPQLGTTKENHDFCETQIPELGKLFLQKGLPLKPINLNTAVLGAGIITQV